MTNNKALVPQEPGKYALVAQAALDASSAMAEALAPGETLSINDLPTVKVPTAGALNWQLPNGDAAKTIDGVILLRQPVRAYWKARFDDTGGGEPPDCTSDDLITGIGNNGTEEGDLQYTADGEEAWIGRHACMTCPWAQFGSAVNAKGEPTAGQRCRQITRLFMVTEDSMLPTLVLLSPTNFTAAKGYAVRQPLTSVETSIGLEPDKSGGGITYSRATFKAVRKLEPEERAAMEAYKAAIMPFLRQTTT